MNSDRRGFLKGVLAAGVADTGRCQIATSIAQYSYGKGAITLVGPCVNPAGGTLALHSSSNCEIGSAEWREFLGGTFLFHYPRHFPVPFADADRSHPAIACMPQDYVWADDEIYVNDMVSGAVKPLLSFRADAMPDEMRTWLKEHGRTAENGRHILEWTKTYGKGRVYYSALGHNAGDFTKPEFLEHLYRAVLWTMG